MADDIRTRLSEALQFAEDQALEARGRIVGGNWDVSLHHRRLAQVVERGALIAENLPNEIAAHIARWDPGTVLRLVARDRQMLADYDTSRSAQFPDFEGGVAAALDDELERAAAFWLGTPEES